ncbi:hypothetical protein DXT94_07945 [Rhizobium sp. ICMP 5592]|nr:hypothetical protein [Rhizobium sp. ICMP 5592]
MHSNTFAMTAFESPTIAPAYVSAPSMPCSTRHMASASEIGISDIAFLINEFANTAKSRHLFLREQNARYWLQ